MPLNRSGSRSLPLPALASFGLLVLMILASVVLAFSTRSSVVAMEKTWEYRRTVTDLALYLRDAEIGQRGMLLTGNADYLAPYDMGVGRIGSTLDKIARMQGRRGVEVAAELKPLVDAKISVLREALNLDAAGKHDAALAVVRTNRGKLLMDELRTITERERAWSYNRADALATNVFLLSRWLTVGLVIGALLVALLSLLWLTQARRQFAEVDRTRGDAEAALAALRTESAAREASETQVRQLQKMESIGQLTGGIAHDFNNMLAVVMGSLELAQRRLRTDPDRVEKHLEHAREGATRAASLTARLLAFSRRQPLAPVPLEVNKLLDGLCEMLTRTLGDAISLECIGGAGTWRCYADPGEIENSIVNLAINARDAMPEGGKLTIETANAHIDDAYARTRNEVEPGQYVVICVTDTGIGMTKEVIDRAFDPFFTTKEVGKGTGLGLSQVFGFAKQSGGHVAIYSEVGEGTTVKLYLPRFIGAQATAEAPIRDDTTPVGQPHEIILVVEDETRVRHFAVDALRELGYSTVSAGSPAEALHLLEQDPEICLLFTDIVMPDMNGRRLADLARTRCPELKVLFTTGYTRNAVVHNGMVDAGVAFLPKPYSIADLARKVRDVIEGRGANRG